MRQCTCPPGDYPAFTGSHGARYAVIGTALVLLCWWSVRLFLTRRTCAALLLNFCKQGIKTVLQKCKHQEMPLLQKKVVNRVRQNRLELHKVAYVYVLAPFAGPIFCIYGLYTGVFAETASFQSQTVARTIGNSLLSAFLGLYFATFPGHLSPRVADFTSAAQFLLLGVQMILAGTDVDYQRMGGQATMFQLIYAMALADSSKVWLLCAVNWCLQVSFVLYNPILNKEPLTNVVNTLTAPAIIIAGGYFTEFWLHREAAAAVNEKEASRSKASCQSLLDIMCDAVVLVTPEMELIGEWGKLNAVLLRTGLPAETPSFSRFLAQADVGRLQVSLKAAEEPGKSQMIHATLNDAIGNNIPVQIYHTCILDSDDKLHHLLGIAEDYSQEGIHDFPASSARERFPESAQASTTHEDSASGTEESPRSEGSRASSRKQICLTHWGPDNQSQPVGCVLQLGLKLHGSVMSETPACAALLSFGQCKDLSHFLARFEDPAKIKGLLRESMLTALQGKRGEVLMSSFPLEVLNTSGISYDVRLSTCLTSDVQIKNSDEWVTAKLHLRFRQPHEDQPRDAAQVVRKIMKESRSRRRVSRPRFLGLDDAVPSERDDGVSRSSG